MHTTAFADMPWERVDLSAAELDLPIAVGGSTAPHRLLEAYRHGAFPFARHQPHPSCPYPSCPQPSCPHPSCPRPSCPRPHSADAQRELYARHVADGRITAFPGVEDPDAYALTWWSPARRPVLRVGTGQLSRRLRRWPQSGGRWIATCDHAFAGVVDGCRTGADAGWITEPFRASLLSLHAAGWAHSIEVWQGEELIAGLFGIGIGQVFSVDSAFGRLPQATLVAFADLSRRLRGRATFIDTQVPHQYTAALDTRSISRAEYLDTLLAVDLPVEPRPGVLAVEPWPTEAD
ncbi:hypothetical protein [Kitasatospora sp. GAS204B]|uniref:leucyl/phenylalanyl-tRNA--protein transferase n=1 Tax=unclassified Kitasatospora TaxID=2633591 RepID=UPI0024740F11|nr:hypothetical protein [Kitasatospora sp. GAS204B]MDH6122684.1 leucyl/phenylalanyl-tRNA--protein transferase [Kitasatospora sp. GAS204B]